MVDTHVHLLSRQFGRDRESVIERAFQAGNEFLVEVATDLLTSERAVNLALKFDGIYAAVGIHPHDAQTFDDKALGLLEKLAGKPGVVAIGETGLDFYRDLSPRDVQARVFAEQISLARRRNLPLVIHIRNAYHEALEILEREQAFEVGGVLHCFSGDAASAERALGLGFALGFGGTITYEGSGSSRLATTLPLKNIVLETDCPYLSPVQHRQERNEPAYVGLVLDCLAKLRGIPREKVDELTTLNAHELFRVKRSLVSRKSNPTDKKDTR
ncbi:MAG: TatD family hydrolase [Candidatus Eisenbacteria bacterium]|nr:TatD family hydrolase [Candidatus Eisenbacteria bacterium]